METKDVRVDGKLFRGVNAQFWIRFREICYRLGKSHGEFLQEMTADYLKNHPEVAAKANLVIEFKQKVEPFEAPHPDIFEYHKHVM
ncbi:MAG: hypothetical protein WC350_00005, partial [Candidatus Micrarchaeia archaeon]